jgi:Uma2 family endonuclease
MAALPDAIKETDDPVTFAQFEQLPDPYGTWPYELQHGEVIDVPPRDFGHVEVQDLRGDLLKPRVRSFGRVMIECPYRALPDYEWRQADVVAISHERWEATRSKKFFGSPELVIEVRSPSNTKKQLKDLISLCLTTGAKQVWIVEQDKKTVTVYRNDGTVTRYGSGQQIPLDDFGCTDPLAVDEIFPA